MTFLRIVFLMSISFFFLQCNKDDDAENKFVVEGTLYVGCDDQPGAFQHVKLIPYRHRYGFGSMARFQLGATTTDKDGRFSFVYDRSDPLIEAELVAVVMNEPDTSYNGFYITCAERSDFYEVNQSHQNVIFRRYPTVNVKAKINSSRRQFTSSDTIRYRDAYGVETVISGPFDPELTFRNIQPLQRSSNFYVNVELRLNDSLVRQTIYVEPCLFVQTTLNL